MNWQAMIVKLCALRDELALMDDYAANCGHPVFMALDRTWPGMSKADWQFADNVIGYYQELLDLRQLEGETTR